MLDAGGPVHRYLWLVCPVSNVVMARLAELGIAMRVENVRSDGETESRAHKHIGRPVIAGKEAACSQRQCRPVSQNLNPRLRIFVSDNRGHAPGEHGMTAWE